MAKSPTQQEYVMDVLMRNFCRASEENEILYEEINDVRSALSVLFRENADLRFKLREAGVELPPSEFITLDSDEDDVVENVSEIE